MQEWGLVILFLMVVSHGRLKSLCLACHVAFAILDDDKCVGNAITVRMLSVDHNFLQHLSKKLTSTCHNATSAYKLCDDRETHDVQETARNSQFIGNSDVVQHLKATCHVNTKILCCLTAVWPTSCLRHRSFLRAMRNNRQRFSFPKTTLASNKGNGRRQQQSGKASAPYHVASRQHKLNFSIIIYLLESLSSSISLIGELGIDRI